jgi:hypothetical protein
MPCKSKPAKKNNGLNQDGKSWLAVSGSTLSKWAEYRWDDSQLFEQKQWLAFCATFKGGGGITRHKSINKREEERGRNSLEF